MPALPTSQSVIVLTLKALAKYANNANYYLDEKTEPGQKSALQAASEDTGIHPSTIRTYVAAAALRFGWTWRDFVEEPEAPPSDDELGGGLRTLREHAPKNSAYIEKQRRSSIRAFVVPKEPFAVAFVGDPHLENKGADLAQFERDLELLRVSGIRAVNMGDLLDNFHETGKLASKQADNRMSVKEGYGVAKWVILDSGVKWDAHILGNHDAWGGHGYASLFSQWAAEAGSRVYDWVIGLSYSWGDGGYKILAAHDFKGHSIHNPLHGPMRRAVEDGWADCYVAGHRHNAAEAAHENGFRNRRYNFLRVKGYKAFDDYAKTRGYPQQKEGASGMVVIDPHAETMTGRAKLFLDLAEGAEFLQYLRRRT